MASQRLQTQRELMLPLVDDITDLDTAKEFLNKLLKVIEETHLEIYSDLEVINTQI